MAIQKITTSNSKESSIGSSLKGSSTTNSSSLKPNDLENPNNPKGNNSSSTINKSINISINGNISKIEFTNFLPISDLISYLTLKTKAKETDEINLLKEFKDNISEQQLNDPSCSNPYFSIHANSSGNVNCTFLMNISNKDIFSYKLERKKQEIKTSIRAKSAKTLLKPIETWDLVAESTSYGYLHIRDMTVEDGSSYTYRLRIEYRNETLEFEDSVQYKKKKKIEVLNFYANADPTKKSISITCLVKNATKEIITRKDSGKEITSPYIDGDVKPGETYVYVLEASNEWERKKFETEVTCPNGPDFSAESIKLKIEVLVREKGITLKWPEIPNVTSATVYRKRDETEEWKPLRGYHYGSGEYYLTDTDAALEQGAWYTYYVQWSNAWGSVDSEKVRILMKNDVPKKPQMLPPDRFTLKLLISETANSYSVIRMDNPSQKWSHTCPKTFYPNSVYYVTDNTLVAGQLYTYKVIAHNGWGDSVVYHDVMIPKEISYDDGHYVYNDKKQIHVELPAGVPWTRDFQGITTDGEWWYITNGTDSCTESARLRKARVNESLDQYFDIDYKTVGVHFGDLDCYKNFLFVAAYKESEDNRAEIWVFDKNNLSDRITTIALLDPEYHKLTKSGWCAVNPCNGRLYTSESNIYDGVIYSYKIEIIDGCFKGLSSCQREFLYDEYGNPLVKESMQGGCFDYYNNLYLSSGFGKDDDGNVKIREGIQVFKLVHDDSVSYQEKLNTAKSLEEKSQIYESYVSGNLELPFVEKFVMIAKSAKKDCLFKYNFDSSGDCCGHFFQEPQGLVYYDFANSDTQIQPYYDSMKSTSFHAGVLDNKPSLYDGVYIKSYYHMYRDTEEKTLYYDVSKISAKDCKIIENEKTIKELSSSEKANGALSILNNFKRIHTIGWLITSSPNHNYEFSVLEWGSETISQKADFVISYDSVNGISSDFSNGKHYVLVKGSDKSFYLFYAHNADDCEKIKKLLRENGKICIYGNGPAYIGNTYTDLVGKLYCIHSTNNLIWLE